MDEIMSTIYNGLLTVGVTVVGFFLKRCVSQMDEKANKSEIKTLRTEVEGKAEQTELDKTIDEIREFRQTYATKEQMKETQNQMQELKSSVEFLKENTVRKDDFVRVTTEISSKIDDLSAYLRGKIL